MQIHEEKQGTPEWLALRALHFTASEATAMMGASKHMSRTQLLDVKKSGIVKEVSSFTQSLFDKGHAAEEQARQLYESGWGEEIFPVTGSLEVDGLKLLASFDGLNLSGDVAWEHKLWNETLAKIVMSGSIPETHYWQLEQQLLVSGANSVVFVVSDGTLQNMEYCEYIPVPGRAAQLIAGWTQFSADLKTHEVKPVEVTVIAEPTMALPTLLIKVGGEISIQSNLNKFGEQLKVFVAETNRSPISDQDFANLEAACKTLKEAEDALKKAEASALSQTESVDEMRRTIAFLSDIARTHRLLLEKLVKSEKENRKLAIVMAAEKSLSSHHALLQKDMPGIKSPFAHVNFFDAIKGKRVLSSMQEDVDDMLAWAKIEANAVADDIRIKLVFYADTAVHHPFLFNDLQVLLTKPYETFKADIYDRIAEYDQIKKAAHEEYGLIKTESAALPFNHPPPGYPGNNAMITAVSEHFNIDALTAVNWLHKFN